MLDASVAAKLVLCDEPLRAQAVWWLAEHDQKRLQLVVPGLFWTEIASLLRQAVTRGRLTRASARAAFESTLGLELVTVTGPELAGKALERGTAALLRTPSRWSGCGRNSLGGNARPLCSGRVQVASLGIDFNHSCYDMVYAALALRLGTHVVTADERWVRAAGTRLPLRWLGSL